MTATSRRAYLPNPDEIWPHERTFADICSDLAEEHSRHAEQIEFLEARIKEWSDKLDALEQPQ